MKEVIWSRLMYRRLPTDDVCDLALVQHLVDRAVGQTEVLRGRLDRQQETPVRLVDLLRCAVERVHDLDDVHVGVDRLPASDEDVGLVELGLDLCQRLGLTRCPYVPFGCWTRLTTIL